MFGSMVLIANIKCTIREMNFPQRLEDYKEAQSIMALGMGRTTILGLALHTYYFPGQVCRSENVAVNSRRLDRYY
jgi:hypothetical protein